MMRKELLTFGRSISTITAKYRPSTEPPNILQQLDSYLQPNPRTLVYSYNKAINYQVKHGSLKYAHKLFDEMPVRDVVTWNTLITGYGRHGLPLEALNLYNQMVFEGFNESSTTFSSVLSLCCDARLFVRGLEIHCRAIILGFSVNVYVVSTLVDLYMQMGLCDVALRLFNDLPDRNLAVWNLVLRGFGEMGRSSELLRMYYVMKEEGVVPNALTFCYLIRGCGNERCIDEGRQLHCSVIKNGWCELNLFVANALVDFYAACGNVEDAQREFEVIYPEDVISWNSMVYVYAINGYALEAVKLFSEMQYWGEKPSIRAFVGLLSLACGEENILLGEQIHCFVMKMRFDIGSVHVQSALIDMYGKCGDIQSSVSVHEDIPEINLESCNSLMTSLLRYGIVKDVAELFALMFAEDIGFDEVSLSTTLKALSISSSASFVSCTMLHCCVIKSGFALDRAVLCSLIDAYSRSGHVKLSHQIFETLPSVNVICFTSIINAYARNGMGLQGLGMLKEMIQKGLEPDKVTFLCVLNGCNHSGLIEEAKMVFASMRSLHGIDPDRKHYSCMVDLFGRAGLLEDAEEMLNQAPNKDDSILWSSLLRSCRIHQNESVGRRVAEVIMDLEPEDPDVWLQASNFYSEIGEYETSTQIREIAVARKMRMDIGNSLIEVRGRF